MSKYHATIYEMGAQYPHLFDKWHSTAMERNRLRDINAELLAALESIERSITEHCATWSDAGLDYEQIKNARTAIARARGQQ